MTQERRRDGRDEPEDDAPGRGRLRAGDLLGTPPPGTFPGGQRAGELTGAEPADPEEAEDGRAGAGHGAG